MEQAQVAEIPDTNFFICLLSISGNGAGWVDCFSGWNAFGLWVSVMIDTSK
jgi:hypothetical protein